MSCIFTSRRQFLAGSAAFFAWAGTPKLARAEGRDPRFLTIVLRGALDGLATVAPVGDPDWISARGDLALSAGSKTPPLKLTDFYSLHPSMPNLHRMFHAGHATVIHAASSSYRDRSHFDGQDVLESGLVKPSPTSTGWLNRALDALATEEIVKGQSAQAFAVGPVMPMVVRGPAPVLVWAPQQVLPASEDTLMRLLGLYKQTDPDLARVLEERLSLAPILQSEGTRPAAILANPRAPPSCAPTTPKLQQALRRHSRMPTARALVRWRSRDGTRTPAKALSPANSTTCSGRWMARSPPRKKLSVRHGARQ